MEKDGSCSLPYPLAYLITFTCYGTFLHGDARGATDRNNNRFGAPFVHPNYVCVKDSSRRMKYPAYQLTKRYRMLVMETIHEVCSHRSWTLRAAHVRSNHLHAVISAASEPEPIQDALKSYASRYLNRAGLDAGRPKRWTRHGSDVYLWTQESVDAAIRYVVDCQGDPMEVFEATNNVSGITEP